MAKYKEVTPLRNPLHLFFSIICSNKIAKTAKIKAFFKIFKELCNENQT